MANKKMVYIAGPISIGDPVQHTRKALEVAELLIKEGFTPFIPHLSIFWNFIFPHDIDWWLDYDMEILKRCDAVLRLNGESTGANKEVMFACKNNIPVYYSTTELYEMEGGNE